MIPYTIGIPMTVEPTNHKASANKKLEMKQSFKRTPLSICAFVCKEFTKSFKYVVISVTWLSEALFTKIIPKINPIKNNSNTILYSLILFFKWVINISFTLLCFLFPKFLKLLPPSLF